MAAYSGQRTSRSTSGSWTPMRRGRGTAETVVQDVKTGRARPSAAQIGERVYVAQRKPVAAGRGGSGLPGRLPGGSSSL